MARNHSVKYSQYLTRRWRFFGLKGQLRRALLTLCSITNNPDLSLEYRRHSARLEGEINDLINNFPSSYPIPAPKKESS